MVVGRRPSPTAPPARLSVHHPPPVQGQQWPSFGYEGETGPHRQEEEEEEEEEQEQEGRIGCWREITADEGAELTGTYDEIREGVQHQAIDIAVPNGTEVYAPQSGTVVATRDDMTVGEYSETKTAGNFAYVEDDEGRTHRIMHLATVSVEVGDSVSAGESIGTSDDTGKSYGPHVHYDLSTNGQRSGRIDPEEEFDCDD